MFSLDENQKPVDDGVVVPEPVVMPTSDSSATTPTPVAVSDPVVASEPSVEGDKPTEVSGDLADLQKQAISELAPILGKLDLSNEDKFNTTMMMVQATDNKTLLKDAHEAAKAIEDEKVRAQALLDIINEINYFTTKNN
ncbi:MAG: hypothetical protein AAB624_02340 [Patescibacteria group bacterium]